MPNAIFSFSVGLSLSHITHSFLKSLYITTQYVLAISPFHKHVHLILPVCILLPRADSGSLWHAPFLQKDAQPSPFWNSILSGPSTILQTLLRLLWGLPSPCSMEILQTSILTRYKLYLLDCLLPSMHPKCWTLEDIQRISAGWRQRVMPRVDNCWICQPLAWCGIAR